MHVISKILLLIILFMMYNEFPNNCWIKFFIFLPKENIVALKVNVPLTTWTKDPYVPILLLPP